MSGLVGAFESAITGFARRLGPRSEHGPGAAGTAAGGFAIGTALPMGEGLPMDVRDGAVDGGGVRVGDPVVLRDDALEKHTCVYGGSGGGKSTLMRRLRLYAYRAGHATLDVDFSGDGSDIESRQLVELGPDAPETALVDLRQREYVCPMNLLGGPGSAHARAAGLLRQLQSETTPFGPRINYNMMGGAIAMAELGYGIGEFRPLFAVEPGFRRHVLARVRDEVARAVLVDFDRLPPETQRSHYAELSNKLAVLAFDPTFRLMAEQPGFPDLGAALDRPARATLVALGAARNPAATLFAKALLAAVERHVMGRASADEGSRQPTRVFIDEASRVAGFGLESLLAEGRRMRCSLTLAMQATHQAEPALRAAMRANAATQVFFAAGGTEASELASEVVCGLPRERVRDVLISLKVGQALVVRRGEPAVKVQMPDSPAPAVEAQALAAFREAALGRAGVPRADAEEETRRRRAWIAGLDGQAAGGGPQVVHTRRPLRREGGDA